MGGPSQIESAAAKTMLQGRKGVTNIQAVFQILNKLCEAIQRKNIQLKPLYSTTNINGNGYLSRPEFTQMIHKLDESITLEQVRVLNQFFDQGN